jgi:5-(carboxyamino)imidazole ribonucleotide synthase
MAARNPAGEVRSIRQRAIIMRIRFWPGAFCRRAFRRSLNRARRRWLRELSRSSALEGLLCVEIFVTRRGELLVNELAPRPHNSYHQSERGCVTSQFEQAVRAVCNLPLGSTELITPAAIVNLLGDVWLNGEPDFAAALAVPGVRLHLYEKHTPRAGRKMGHLSSVGATAEEALERVLEAKRRL